MKSRVWWVAVLLAGSALRAGAAEPFPTYEAFRDELLRVTARDNAAERRRGVDALWQRLRELDQIPFRHGDRVAFLYLDRRGNAAEVAWRGDMTKWELLGSHIGRRIGDSRVWWVEDVLPEDGRFDYKIFLDGSEWILDPDNPHRQVGGYGPNSELRMPGWLPADEARDPAGVARGRLGSYRRHTSTAVPEYVVTYRVYTPAGYHGGQESYPAVYFTDGHEYADSEMGRAIEILDNGIADGVLPPLVAVFLDPRDPRDDRNRRAWEYAEFPEKYSRIVVDEIVPAVDDAFRTKREAGHRVLIGTSLGALFALHVALAHGATFGGVVAQSPAMEYDEYARGDRLRDEIVSASGGKTRIFLDVGTMHDDLARTRATRAQLEAAGFPVRWTEVHEGHSWGHWRAWIDDGIRFGLGID